MKPRADRNGVLHANAATVAIERASKVAAIGAADTGRDLDAADARDAVVQESVDAAGRRFYRRLLGIVLRFRDVHDASASQRPEPWRCVVVIEIGNSLRLEAWW